jgi:hypothetical protein
MPVENVFFEDKIGWYLVSGNDVLILCTDEFKNVLDC